MIGPLKVQTQSSDHTGCTLLGGDLADTKGHEARIERAEGDRRDEKGILEEKNDQLHRPTGKTWDKDDEEYC